MVVGDLASLAGRIQMIKVGAGECMLRLGMANEVSREDGLERNMRQRLDSTRLGLRRRLTML